MSLWDNNNSDHSPTSPSTTITSGETLSSLSPSPTSSSTSGEGAAAAAFELYSDNPYASIWKVTSADLDLHLKNNVNGNVMNNKPPLQESFLPTTTTTATSPSQSSTSSLDSNNLLVMDLYTGNVLREVYSILERQTRLNNKKESTPPPGFGYWHQLQHRQDMQGYNFNFNNEDIQMQHLQQQLLSGNNHPNPNPFFKIEKPNNDNEDPFFNYYCRMRQQQLSIERQVQLELEGASRVTSKWTLLSKIPNLPREFTRQQRERRKMAKVTASREASLAASAYGSSLTKPNKRNGNAYAKVGDIGKAAASASGTNGTIGKKRRLPASLLNPGLLKELHDLEGFEEIKKNEVDPTITGVEEKDDLGNGNGTEDEEHSRGLIGPASDDCSLSDICNDMNDLTLTTHQSPGNVWNNDNPMYSKKLFVGGLPTKRVSKEFIQGFLAKEFNPILTQWHQSSTGNSVPGFVHLVFRHIDEVLQILRKCKRGGDDDGLYYKFSGGLIVEVIPWDMRQNSYVNPAIKDPTEILESYVVFVAGLHGLSSAQYLYDALDQLFGNVLKTELETDRYGYPLGMGRVTFYNKWSFMMAINKDPSVVNLVDLKDRRVLIEPFLSTLELCSVCAVHQGPYFCRNFDCLKYYCITCFREQHKVICLSPEEGDPTRIFQHRIMFKDKTQIQKDVSDSILSSIYCECTTGFLI